MSSKKNFLNWVFTGQLVLFGLIVTGILPRETALYLGMALVIYFLAASPEDSLVFFVRSIPLFLALPLTDSFDNFNTWRILSAIIFLKWAWPQIYNFQFTTYNKFSISQFFKKLRPHTILLLILLLFAFLSVVPASDKIAAIKRIIYFLNLAVLGIVVYDKTNNKEFAKRLIRNSVIPVVIVVVVGYIQVISTYFIDIYQFMRIWGEGIQCRQFGTQWCTIAVEMGNTWFAYYGEQLSLRVFSLFPDSHSFPQFVLLGVPAVLAVVRKKWTKILVLSFLFLITILSGTRGIWAASVAAVLLAGGLIFWMKHTNIITPNIVVFRRLTAYLVIFFIMFMVAFPIFTSPQFLLSKDNSEILRARIKSILDFGETSNAQRIEIWKKTFSSIKERPLLGVGIGNYPAVLGQDIRLAKAGSSAHNIYLQIAAEMGIPALIFALWFLWILMQKIYANFTTSKDWEIAIYYGATLIFVPWVLIYSLTDVAIFDERAFLMFVATISLILATKNPD